jgi:hypothetical protein
MAPERLNPTAGERLDPNKLAALIDGHLSAADRDVVLARLSASPDDLELVADVLAVAGELDDGVTDIRSAAAKRTPRRPPLTRWLSVAAAILVIATLPVMMRYATTPKVDGYASLLSNRVALAPGWDQLAWSATRGSADDISERARAVRAGALTTAIDVSVAHADSAVTRLARQMASLLAGVTGANDAMSTYARMAENGASVSPAQVRTARADAREAILPREFDNGAWLEAARIAAVDHDTAFFNTTASRAQLAALKRDPPGDDRTRADVFSVGRFIEGHDWDWDALADKTTSILAFLAAS